MKELLLKLGYSGYICQTGNIMSEDTSRYLLNSRKVILIPSLSKFIDSQNNFDYCKDTGTDQTCEYELSDIHEYKQFITQNLTKDMFVGDTKIFGIEMDWTVDELEEKGFFNGDTIEYLVHEMNSVGNQLYFIPE